MSSSVRSASRSRFRRPPTASPSKTFPKASAGRPAASTLRWKLDARGRIAHFDMKTLRADIVRRLSSAELPLYTLQECRTFLLEIAAAAAAWQEEEIPRLAHLSDLREKLLPGKPIAYQWPAEDTHVFPNADIALAENGAMQMIAQVVEEINRSIVRLIDRVWDSRRDRLLFAARLLEDIEPMLAEAHEHNNNNK